MPTQPKIRYTYEDYLSTPEDSSRRYEIVDGELFVTPTPRLWHQEVVMNLGRLLSTLAIEHGLGKVWPGPVTVRLADDTVTEPDIVFVSAARLDIVDPRRGILGAPDLVVEILSPSNRGYDRTLKRKRYLESGVPELWIVDADGRWIEVWRRDAERSRVLREATDRVIEWRVGQQTFELPLAEIFRG